jgi:hypothetical protein
MGRGEENITAWHRLYDAAQRIKDLAPWEWMDETDIFGVELPGTNLLGFVSVMGARGEYFAVSVYLGEDTLGTFWNIHHDDSTADDDAVMEMRQIMASFEDRGDLEKKDHDIIRRLGLKFRGKKSWPMFRSYRPGYVPWFLEDEEVEWLSCALEQTPEVSLRFKDDPSLLEHDDAEGYLIRVAERDKNGWVWRDSVRRIAPPEPEMLTIQVDVSTLETFAALPRRKLRVDMDFFLAPGKIGKPGKRPSCIYVLLAAEPKSGQILGYEVFQALDGMVPMWEQIPDKAVSVLSRAGFRPAVLRVRSDRLLHLLQPLELESRLGIKIRHRHRLRAIEEAKEAMFQFLAKP